MSNTAAKLWREEPGARSMERGGANPGDSPYYSQEAAEQAGDSGRKEKLAALIREGRLTVGSERRLFLDVHRAHDFAGLCGERGVQKCPPRD